MSCAPTGAGVVIQTHPRFGSSLFAAKCFAAADIVLCEEPLLLSASLRDPEVRKLHSAALEAAASAHGYEGIERIPPADWLGACAWLVAFTRAPAGTQKIVLEELHTKPAVGSLQAKTSDLQAHIVVLSTGGATVRCADQSAEPSALDRSTVQKALLAYHLNAHQMRELRGNAVYHLGSKLAHTCGVANTEYKTYNRKGYHIALRHIEAGELLTTTYLGARDKLLSSSSRQRLLDRDFGFRCCCERCCRTVDDMSCLPCQYCATAAEARRPDGTLPPAVASGKKGYTGVLQFNPSLVNNRAAGSLCSSRSEALTGSGSIDVTEVLPWSCSKCGKSLPDTDSALFGSSLINELPKLGASRGSSSRAGPTSSDSSKHPGDRLEDLVSEAIRSMDQRLDMIPVSDTAETRRLMGLVAKCLGPKHGAMLYAVTLHLEMLMAMMKGCGTAVVELRMMGRPVPAGMILKDLGDYVSEAEESWERIWTWLAQRPELDGAQLLLKELVHNAWGLLEAAGNCQPILVQSKGQQLLTRLQKLANKLLPMLQSQMEIYGRWPLPEPHPLHESYKGALAIQAKLALASSRAASTGSAAATGPAGGCSRAEQSLERRRSAVLLAGKIASAARAASGSSSSTSTMVLASSSRRERGGKGMEMEKEPSPEGLSMQQLLEFLPSATSSSTSGSKKGKAKRKGKKSSKK